MSDRPTPETNKNAQLLANLDEWIDDSLRNSKPIGLTLCAARDKISEQSKRIAEFWDAMEILRRERDEAREKYDAEATEHMLAVNKLCGERDKAREDATNYYAKIGELEDERDRLQAELDENYIISGRSANREWKLITELNQAKKLAADWEECANQFFFCAGKDKTASWEQFEKAATTYQFLRKKVEV